MPRSDDLYVAEYALQRELITREQLLEALWQIQEGGDSKPLGVFLVEAGTIKDEVLRSILRARTEHAGAAEPVEEGEELTFGHVVVGIGVVTREQLEECLAIQDASKEQRRLGEILVERGYTTPGQIRRALEYQNKSLFNCSECGGRFNVLNAVPGEEYKCKRCDGILMPALYGQVSAEDTVRIENSGVSPEVQELAGRPISETLPLNEQTESDRALGLYLKQKEIVGREDLRGAERLQLEFSRFGLSVRLFNILKRKKLIGGEALRELESQDFIKVVHGDEWTRQVVPGLTLTGRLSTGDFATIYAAKRLFSNSMAAIKILHRDRASEESNIARFRKEGNLLVRLNHPGIIRVLDQESVPPDLHYMILEYLQGETIDQVVGTQGPMSLDRALDVVRQTADVLAYLEKEGYVHRDVRPEHLLIDEAGRVHLCDVGFAVRKSRGGGAAKEPTATAAAFMSPEQARGDDDLSAATDIYSLGLTLYMMLTGHLLFDGDSSDEIMASRFDQDWGQAPVELPEVPFAGLLQRMLAPGSERIGSWKELREALGEG